MKYTTIAAAAAFAFASLTTGAFADDQSAPQNQTAALQTQVGVVSNQLPAKNTTISDIQPQRKVVPSCTTLGPLPAPANGTAEAAPFYQWSIDWEAVGSVCRAKLF